jgi:hypothetical protein
MSEVWSIHNSKRWIPIECIGFEYHPREHLLEDRIELFVDLLKANHAFGPIRVARENPDGKLYLIDGRYRIEAYRRLGVENVEYELERVHKSFWLLSSAKWNTGGAQPLTYDELKKIVLTTYEAYQISPQKIHDYLNGLCSLRWVYKVLDHKVQADKRKKRQQVIHMRKNGKTFSEIEVETGVKRATASRYLKDNCSPKDAPDQDTDSGWRQLKSGIQKLRDLTITEKETLFALYKIKEGDGADKIAKKMDCAQSVVRNTAYCLLYHYHHGSETFPELLTESFGISEDKALFIDWMVYRCSNILPIRRVLFDWILQNEGDHDNSNKHIAALMRREKLYWQCKLEGKPVPWEDDNSDEIFGEDDLPPKFFETIQATISILNDFKQRSENKRITQHLIKEIMEINNKVRILLNLIGTMLRKQM